MQIGVIELLVIAAPILIGTIVLCVKKPKTGFTVLGTVAGLFFVFMVSFVFSARPVEKTQHIEEINPGWTRTVTGPHKYVEAVEGELRPAEISNEPSAIWSEGVELEYEADVYPSEEAAVKALGKEAVELAVKLNEGKEPKWFEVSKIKLETEDIDLAEVFKKSIQKARLSHDKVLLTSVSKKSDVASIGLILRTFSSKGNERISGTFESSVFIHSKGSTASAKFVEKGWVDNLAEYNNLKPAKEFAVARSYSSCTTAEAAGNEAVIAAVNLVTKRLHETYGDFIYNISSIDLYQNRIITDSFEQTLAGGITDIHRKALLLDMSAKNLSFMHSKKEAEAQKQQFRQTTRQRQQNQSRARMIGSLAGLITVICGVYLFVNAATKGYYTLVLRIVTIAAILIGGAILVLMLEGHIVPL